MVHKRPLAQQSVYNCGLYCIYCMMRFDQYWSMTLWWLQISHKSITASTSLLSGRVTPEQLCSYMQLFRSSWRALESHCGVLQLGLATAQALRHPSLPRWDSCLAFERLLLQVCAHLTQMSYPYVLQAMKAEKSPFKMGYPLLKKCDDWQKCFLSRLTTKQYFRSAQFTFLILRNAEQISKRMHTCCFWIAS